MCGSKAKTVYACVRHAWGSASCKQGPDCKVWFACAHGTWHTPAWLDVHISSGLRPAASERPAANNKRQKAACTRQHAGENDWQCVLHSQRHPAQDRRQGTARGVRRRGTSAYCIRHVAAAGAMLQSSGQARQGSNTMRC